MNVDKDSLAQNYNSRHTDELLEMHASGTLTDLAYEVLENELKLREEPIPDRPEIPDDNVPPETFIEFFTNHWKGKKKLASAYWLIGMGGKIFLAILATILISYIDDHFHLQDKEFLIVLFATLFVLFIPHAIFAAVSIWRCAPNVHNPMWGYIARLYVLMEVLGVLNALTEIYG